VSVVCCQVEVSATSWSLVQRSPTECGVSKMCVIMKRRNEEAKAPEKVLICHRKKKKVTLKHMRCRVKIQNNLLDNLKHQ
jgi:hypothetical protein